MEKEGRTRLALIICNKKFDYLFDRDYADTDILNMQELLENLGYSVVLKENLTAQVMSPEIGATFFVLLSRQDLLYSIIICSFGWDLFLGLSCTSTYLI